MKLKQQIAVLIVSLVCAKAGHAQQRTALLKFSLDRSGQPLAQYTLSVDEQGTGTFNPHLSGATPKAADPDPADSKPIRLSPAVVKRLFAAVPMVEGGHCETHSKSIANTGTKVLRYSGNGREAQCTYNYSDDDRVNEATATFEALAETLMFGDRLTAKLRFDRLGLDSELDELQTAVLEGRALDVVNIAPVLKTISEDERVMDRARRKAERLLQSTVPGQTAEGAAPSVR